MKKIPVTIISGYLGSGKTTLLNNFLKAKNSNGLAIIVNDLGSVNIDARLINKNVCKNEMIELQNGCICCTLRDEFMHQIEELANNKLVDKIIVEASGVSNPVNIADAFIDTINEKKDCNYYLDSIISVCDASRIYNEFLLSLNQENNDDNDECDVINLIIDQIEFCNIVVLNKCDLLNEEQVKEVEMIVKKLQHDAKIIKTINSNLDYNLLFTQKEFDYDLIYDSSAVEKSIKREKQMHDNGIDDFGIESFVYEEKRPFNHDKFYNFLENNYPKSIIRTKGYIWFSNDPCHIVLFETAGQNATVTVYSNWVCALSKQDLEETLKNYPEIKNSWDDYYGDRFNQIVIIGKDMNKEEIKKQLDDCLDYFKK